MSLENLEQSVTAWAKEKGIFNDPRPAKQWDKTIEETEEAIDAFEDLKNGVCSEENLKTEIGDILVTLIIQLHMHGMSLESALSAAFEKISKRTGRMENGVFVKDGGQE